MPDLLSTVFDLGLGISARKLVVEYSWLSLTRVGTIPGTAPRFANCSRSLNARTLLRQKGKSGAPGEIRTPDLLLRRQSLYPSELRAHTNSFSLHGRVKKHQCKHCAVTIPACAGLSMGSRSSAGG